MRILCLIPFILLAAVQVFAAGEALKLSVGHANLPGDVSHTAWEFFKKTLEKSSNNQIRVDVYPAEQLGDERSLVEQVIAGTLDMTTVNIATLAAKYPKFNIYVFPYMWKDRAHMFRFTDGSDAQKLADSFSQAHGAQVMAYWDNGTRHMFLAKKPIFTPQDFIGLKVRSINNDVFISFFKALQATPHPIAFGEVYEALKTGVVDAADNDLSGYISMKFFVPAPYFSLTGHVVACKPLIVGNKTLQRFPEHLQQLIIAAIQETEQFQRTSSSSQIYNNLSFLASTGVRVNEIKDQAAFREIAKNTVWKNFTSVVGQDLINAAVNTP